MQQIQQKNLSTAHNAKQRRKYKKRKKRNFYIRLIISFFIFFIAFYTYMTSNNNIQVTRSDNLSAGNLSEAMPVNAVAPNFNKLAFLTEKIPEHNYLSQNLNINSENAVLMDFENGTILFDKNCTNMIYPASMTKIMTAVIVLEQISDLNETVTLNEEIFKPIYKANAVRAGFVPGESVRVIDLLYGLLLPSGAECAIGLAEYTAGSESAFVELMNEKAIELGMSSTNFTNSIGLHDKNHYSAAMDIAVLLQYALKNDTFYEIFTSRRHSTPSTNKHSGGITYYSTLFSKIDNSNFNGGSILGGKTGYTEEAGQCLASLAIKDNKKYILVTSNAVSKNKTDELHIQDAFTVYAAIK